MKRALESFGFKPVKRREETVDELEEIPCVSTPQHTTMQEAHDVQSQSCDTETLPVTTASNERLFSNLRYLKTYLRSSMLEERLNGLMHLYVSKDLVISVDEVIEMFSSQSRRLDFCI